MLGLGELGLQILYVAAILGAGVVGLITVFAPRIAGENIFFGATEVGPFVQILGALWIALGAVAVVGLLEPQRVVAVPLIQLIYKTVWLAMVGYPALMAGDRSTGIKFFVGLFSVWVVAIILLMPLNSLV